MIYYFLYHHNVCIYLPNLDYLQRFDIHVERAHGNDVNRLQRVVNFRRGAQNGRPPNV